MNPSKSEYSVIIETPGGPVHLSFDQDDDTAVATVERRRPTKSGEGKMWDIYTIVYLDAPETKFLSRWRNRSAHRIWSAQQSDNRTRWGGNEINGTSYRNQARELFLPALKEIEAEVWPTVLEWLKSPALAEARAASRKHQAEQWVKIWTRNAEDAERQAAHSRHFAEIMGKIASGEDTTTPVNEILRAARA